MSSFMFAYYGGKEPANPEEGTKGREAFGAWLASLGNAVVNPGTPLGAAKTVSSDTVSESDGSRPLTGFSIIKAEDLDAAPVLALGLLQNRRRSFLFLK